MKSHNNSYVKNLEGNKMQNHNNSFAFGEMRQNAITCCGMREATKSSAKSYIEPLTICT
ncbi:hypothetical protein HYC85_012257 [Camellia sinensis]|uniref:Uncharacterized protein n=1 Tax=Camellia sinensis TaxID=4442 RepID=A0A7J7HEC8_CAMSI|nr:hypothetical protein HYC85_012257 [Camellia sinensis]